MLLRAITCLPKAKRLCSLCEEEESHTHLFWKWNALTPSGLLGGFYTAGTALLRPTASAIFCWSRQKARAPPIGVWYYILSRVSFSAVYSLIHPTRNNQKGTVGGARPDQRSNWSSVWRTVFPRGSLPLPMRKSRTYVFCPRVPYECHVISCSLPITVVFPSPSDLSCLYAQLALFFEGRTFFPVCIGPCTILCRLS